MTRGRRPMEAVKEAVLIAGKRGIVQQYGFCPGMICNFSIIIAGMLVQVRIKRFRRLQCTIPWLEREAADEIAGLRIIVSSHDISRELWICSPTGAYRFFRVLDTSLVELGRDGLPLPAVLPSRPELLHYTSDGKLLIKTPVALLGSIVIPKEQKKEESKAPSKDISVGEEKPLGS